MSLPVPLMLLLSLVIGAVIGLERESYEDSVKIPGRNKVGSLGVRTFSLITLLGTTAGLLRPDYFTLFLTINITFMLLIVAYYIVGSFLTGDNGITTEIAVVFAYLIGLFLSLEIFPVQLIIAMAVVLILVLSYKQKVHSFVAGITRGEINAFISYAIIALVILPFLPNISYHLTDIPSLSSILSSYGIDLGSFESVEILNPFRLWLVVALITGVDVLGYLLERTVGKKSGWVLASMAGGFISSTATTQSLAQQSKKSGSINLLVASAIFANMTSFFQLFLLIAVFNPDLLVRSTVMILAMIVTATISGLVLLRTKGEETVESLTESDVSLKETNIFSLIPALKFALLFLTIRVVSKVALIMFGDSGFLFTSAIASLAGLDAVIINLSELAGVTITLTTAVWAIIITNGVNLIGKVVYSFIQGNRKFAVKFAVSMLLIIISSFIGLVI
jgi:uncharacterized membrane protein (DUF4010 family)